MSATTAVQNDPVFDHANGQKTAVTISANILTPSSTCVFAWIGTDADIVVNTAGAAAADDGTSVYLPGGFSGIIPVQPSVAVLALSLSGTANVRATGMKIRPS